MRIILRNHGISNGYIITLLKYEGFDLLELLQVQRIGFLNLAVLGLLYSLSFLLLRLNLLGAESFKFHLGR